VLMLLKPVAFEAAFNAWIARLRDEATAETGVDRPIISIDGKAARRSHDAREGLGPLHVVTAWASDPRGALHSTSSHDSRRGGRRNHWGKSQRHYSLRSDRPKHLRRISAARCVSVRLSPSTRERLLRDELAESLDRELSRLPEKYRTPIKNLDVTLFASQN